MSKMLEVKDLSINFGGIKAVRDFSFDIEEGEILALIGPNGCGKSTTVNLISGVSTPNTGTIKYQGEFLTKKHSIATRSKMGIGRTFQTPKPFGFLSVYDNVFSITLQRHGFKEARAKTNEILKMFELDMVCEEPSIKLPIEKRKWLDLARVMATEPKLVMMDECMAGLNPNEMQENLELVKRINKTGVTILFIEHVMRAVVSVCTRAVVMNEGTFLFEGTPETALKNADVIRAYIGGAATETPDESKGGE
ncbi:MAG: ABC transporter ATP-binding protein [Lachnospiraceae bacterium]|nr:ABC transporter ATP-binding protein [Lachnospiraceae bacterium]